MPTPGEARNVPNDVIAARHGTVLLALRPLLIRQRIHRLASCFSHGWGMRPKRRREGGELGGGPALPQHPFTLADPRAGHQVTSFPVNQPAACSAWRASSAVRCP